MKPSGILIRNALVVPPEPESPFYGWVHVLGSSIERLGAGDAPSGGFSEVIDAGGHALIPGLVNTHAHSHSSLTRGSAEGFALDDWLRVIEREQARLTPDQEYAGAMATYAEALLSGTTSIVDMCLHPAAAFRAAQDIGIRAVIVPYVADGKSFTPTLAENAELLQSGGNGAGDRVRVWVGLHDLESCSDPQVRAGAELARSNGVGVHLHCSETRRSVERTRNRTGRTPVAQLAELGALGERTLLAHCVWVSGEDRDLLAAAGAHVAHCPHANLKLGSGIAPVPDLLARGVNVTLATDGAKANNRLDLFDVMKFASLLHKGVAEDPTVLPPEIVLDMATRRGGLAIGARVGAVAPGMEADLVLVRLDGFHVQPSIPETIRTNLVHAARGSDVATVLVAGRVVVRDGRVASVDQAEILDGARRVAQDLIAI